MTFSTMELHDKQAITPCFSYLYFLFIPSTLKIHGTFPWLVLVNIVQEYQVSLPSNKNTSFYILHLKLFHRPMCMSQKFLFDLCHTFSLGQVRQVDWIPQSHYLVSVFLIITWSPLMCSSKIACGTHHVMPVVMDNQLVDHFVSVFTFLGGNYKEEWKNREYLYCTGDTWRTGR